MPVTAVLVLLADQISKHFVVAGLPEGQSVEVASWLAPVLHFTHVTNTGAAFGLFRGGGDFFIVISAIVIVAIIVFYRQLPDSQWLMRVALGLQLGGATGNFLDRLRHDGSVVDFIDLHFWPLREWPVFNVADSSLVVGVILLALLLVDEERRERGQQLAASDG
jgi:signal peptidase II